MWIVISNTYKVVVTRKRKKKDFFHFTAIDFEHTYEAFKIKFIHFQMVIRLEAKTICAVGLKSSAESEKLLPQNMQYILKVLITPNLHWAFPNYLRRN
jgi:hypothetical protein